MASTNSYTLYRYTPDAHLVLGSKGVGNSSLWKYKNLWFRAFTYEGKTFQLLAEQRDIGDGYLFAESAKLTQELHDRGVKPQKGYKVLSVEGDPADLSGRLYHLERDFTLEVKLRPEDGRYRVQMYPAAYNGMNQKRCLVRCTVEQEPLLVMNMPIVKVYEGPKEEAPDALKSQIPTPKSGCLSSIAFFLVALMAVGMLLLG